MIHDVHAKVQFHALGDREDYRLRAMQPDAFIQQAERGKHLPADFHPGFDPLNVIPQPQQNNHRSANNDTERHRANAGASPARKCDATGRNWLVASPVIHPKKHRHPAKVGHRRAVHLPDLVRLIDDAVVARDHLHDRREQKRDDECRVKNVNVRRDDLVGGVRRRWNLPDEHQGPCSMKRPELSLTPVYFEFSIPKVHFAH